ncbi:MAG: c-type cytochrome [Verrucomicrobiota bacterium]
MKRLLHLLGLGWFLKWLLGRWRTGLVRSRSSARSLARTEDGVEPKRSRIKRWILKGAAILLLLALGGFLLSASGLVSIKASSGHWAATRWFLQFSKGRSVSTHAMGLKPPRLTDATQVLKGAGHYETGCAPCHGSPLRAQPRVAEKMLPRPPNLRFSRARWAPNELFYIVKHGIKLTGMPAWPASMRDDEVWAVVAFLEMLPRMTADEYRQLANGGIDLPDTARLEKLEPTNMPPRLAKESCARCHGIDGNGRGSSAFPKLAGQKVEYLERSLQAYARGQRHSGIMEPVAAGLDAPAIRELAEYYASLPRKFDWPADSPSIDAKSLERGRVIAQFGIPKQGVPACIECHGADSLPRNAVYPSLAGQYHEYLLLQLELFHKNQRGGTDYSHLMQTVAKRLAPEQMRDVALYWSLARRDVGSE